MSRPVSYGGSTGRTFRSNAPVPPLPVNTALQSSMSNTFDHEDVPLAKEVSSRRPSLKTSMIERLGSSQSFILITTTLCILASIAFISFLWFVDDRNTAWRNLASNDDIVIAVSISSLVLRVAIALQAGIATCMLASLALEQTGVLLPHVASVSMIRNSNSSPHDLAYFLLHPTALQRDGSYKRYLAPGLLVLLLLTTFLSQLTSTALLYDISVGLVPGFFVQSSPATNLKDNEAPTSSQTSTWLKRPISYAAFAEYEMKSIVTQSPSRISDTGLSLRALLPISDRQDRMSLQKYSGSATVIDTRVLCVAPDAVLDESGNLAFLTVPQETLQNYTNSAGNYSRLVQDLRSRALISFSDIKIDPLGNFTLNQLSGQLTQSFLLGQFQELSNDTDPFSTKQNIFNQYIITKVINPFPNNTFPRSLGNPTQSYSSEWLRLTYRDFTSSAGMFPQIAFTLCYNSLSALDMAIIASTNATRMEALPVSTNGNTGQPMLDDVRNQLGDFGGSPNERGLLEITFPDGVPHGPSAGQNNSDYIRDEAQWVQLNNASKPHPLTLSMTGGGANSSHPDFANLLNQIMASDDDRPSTSSIAFAMQSLTTLLAQTVYYEQLPRFNNRTVVQQTKLVPAAIPGGQASKYRSAPAGFQPGYVAAIIVTFVHTCLVIVISCLFFSQTKFSTLSSSWSALSQAFDPLTKKYISASHLASDAEVSRWMREDKVNDLAVTLTSTDDGRSTCLKEMKRSGNGVMEEGGLQISHWDERLGAAAYFYSESIAAQRPRQKLERQRPPWM